MRLHLEEKSESEQQRLTERQQKKKIRELTIKCTEVLTLIIIIISN